MNFLFILTYFCYVFYTEQQRMTKRKSLVDSTKKNRFERESEYVPFIYICTCIQRERLEIAKNSSSKAYEFCIEKLWAHCIQALLPKKSDQRITINQSSMRKRTEGTRLTHMHTFATFTDYLLLVAHVLDLSVSLPFRRRASFKAILWRKSLTRSAFVRFELQYKKIKRILIWKY